MTKNYLFHRVNPQREKLWDPMDVALFERCIKYISNHCETVLFEELMESGNLAHGKKYATIMFDDGFKDNIEYAAPILSKYKCKASFYVVTDCIDQNIPTWTYNLEYLFQHTGINTIDLNFDFLPAELKTEKLESNEERIAYVSRLKPQLKKLSDQQRSEILERVTATYSDVELPQIMMNWDDLVQLKNEGHYIGSHTVTHAMLGTIADEKKIMDELVNSGKRIEEKMGYFPVTISYPVGSFNATVKDLAKTAGYKIGLAVKQNVYDPAKDDLFEISRIELYNEPWWKTKMRITNVLENLKSIIRYK